MSDKAWEAIKSIMFCSPQSRPWYKGSFISFIEESKYIWLQDTQPDSSSLRGGGIFLGTKMAELDSGPNTFTLKPDGLSRTLLNRSELAVENKVARNFQKQRQFWIGPTQKSRSALFLPDWITREGSQEVRSNTGRIFSAHCFRGATLPLIQKSCQFTWLGTSSEMLIRSTHCHLLSGVEW